MKARVVAGLLLMTLLLSACRYSAPQMDGWDISQRTRDSLTFFVDHHYTLNTNFEVQADSIALEQLPVVGLFKNVSRGDRLVVAEFAVDPADSLDSVRVKVARDQETQGWISESELLEKVVPVDPVSQCIHWFSDVHSVWFIVVFVVFTLFTLLRAYLKKQFRLVYFNDIDSIFPLLLCFLVAFSATLYASMQTFVPETWKHFYYNPGLNPFRLPFILGLFVASVWAIVVVTLAVLGEVFRRVSLSTAVFYLMGLLSVCILCYLFFTLTVPFYAGYLFLFLFFILLVRKTVLSFAYKYRCGNCGAKLRETGECPHCGAVNL